MVKSVRGREGRAPLGCLGTLALLGVFIYVVSVVGPPWLRYQQFRDEMHADAQFASTLPDSVIRNRLLLRADSLGLPPQAKRVTIHRTPSPRVITIQAEYKVVLHFILFGDKVITFRPRVEEPI